MASLSNSWNPELADSRARLMDRLLILQEAFRQVFDDDQLVVTPETSRRDVPDWDSVAQVKLILFLEEEFGIQFTEDEMSSIQTVGDFLASIETHKTGG
jgi:acyl carrier protein